MTIGGVIPAILGGIIMQSNIQIEYTDTFCGEANYSWVKRFELTVPEELSDKTLMRIAKELCGLAGVRGQWYECSDSLKFIPANSNTVLFITF